MNSQQCSSNIDYPFVSAIKEIIQNLQLEACVIINKKLVQKMELHPAVIYSELVSLERYYTKKNKLRDGYFYVTGKDLENATGLTKRQQPPLIDKLVKDGWISTRFFDDTSYKYYKINHEKVKGKESSDDQRAKYYKLNEAEKINDRLRKGSSIIVNKRLIGAIGLHAAVIYTELLSRYMYFAIRCRLTNNKFFYNTINDLNEGTGLSDNQQRKVLKKLVNNKYIFMTKRRNTRSRYFKINLAKEILPEPEIDDEFAEETHKRNSEKNTTDICDFHRHNYKSNYSTNTDMMKRYLEQNDEAMSEEIMSVFENYLLFFEDTMKSDHPVLKKTLIPKLAEKILNFMHTHSIDSVHFKAMIEDHFNTHYGKDIDYNICHFLTDGIINIKLYNIGIYNEAESF